MTSITTGERTVVRVSGTGSDQQLGEAVAETALNVADVGPTGATGIEPLLAVTRGGQTAFHVRCSPERVRGVVSELQDSSDVTAGSPDAVVDHDPGATRLPVPSLSGLGTGERVVLGACGWRRPAHPDDHEAAGGFPDSDPADVMELGEDLHGRGWGDWCQDEAVAATWERVQAANGGVVVVNAHGTTAETLLLESAPFEVLDGAMALAETVGADRVVVYASREDGRAVETAREAVDAYPEMGTPTDVVIGPPAYRAAEPTMALEAIEGNHRLEARLRPPGPDEVGLHGDPTAVHTARTLAQLGVALREGSLPGTRTVTVSGDVNATATVEVPETGTLRDAIDAVEIAGQRKALCVGGRFGGVTGDPDVGVDPETLTAADLGTEGTVEVLAEERCLVEFVGRQARFASEENCGRCVPCREGTTQLADQLRDVYDGEYDPAGLAELARVMRTSSICQFGVDAGRPTRTALVEFDAEFAAHADGRCPAGSCRDALEVT